MFHTVCVVISAEDRFLSYGEIILHIMADGMNINNVNSLGFQIHSGHCNMYLRSSLSLSIFV